MTCRKQCKVREVTMIEIKEQAYGLGLCVQKVQVSQGILYPDVSSCLTFTAVSGDELVGAHIALFDKAANVKKGKFDLETMIKDSTIYFVKNRIESFMGKAATNNFVIGWVDSWPPDQFNKLLKGQFESAWCANLWNAPAGGSSADIKFLTNGSIEIDMKEGGVRKYTIPLNWQNPKAQEPFFRQLG